MDKLKFAVTFIGIGIVIGVGLLWILISVFRARLSNINIGPWGIELATDDYTQTVILSGKSNNIQSPQLSIIEITQKPSNMSITHTPVISIAPNVAQLNRCKPHTFEEKNGGQKNTG